MSNHAMLVTWQDGYALDLDEIDDQHRMLFDIMNRLWSAIIRRAETVELGGILEDLERYTVLHFTEEETFMRSISYMGFDEHIEQHRRFVDYIIQEKRSALAGRQVSLELIHFLRDWLVNHILVEDKRYADQFRQERRPVSLLGRFFARLH
ncbi:bacteriohemerythrin [Parazoarcus communis]|jgi:hemerythrin|uniref:Hemerythrin n=1 Tax=Parazoarcus communis SWub3 = DSM 12120 TaxID=1121029 RepID=A0A323UNH4_9RHOO|nr:bacteriohemerythrin [Parazoarcus communis]NMG72101.1 bacteriohemerythrin [Parazoarcus communis SWub3 = DSM 12120]PZA14542.1 hemerythrin [Azoarcus communis] [Parazoarcus communis SWub3 = DSM 12120]